MQKFEPDQPVYLLRAILWPGVKEKFVCTKALVNECYDHGITLRLPYHTKDNDWMYFKYNQLGIPGGTTIVPVDEFTTVEQLNAGLLQMMEAARAHEIAKQQAIIAKAQATIDAYAAMQAPAPFTTLP